MLKKIMKTTLILLIIAVLVALMVDTLTTNPRSIASQIIKTGNLTGNSLCLAIKFFKIIPAGTATLKNLGLEKYRDGRDVYHLTAQATSANFLSSIFTAKSKVDSFIDAKELHTLLFLEHSEISNKATVDKEIIYDQEKNTMKFKDEDRKIFPHTQDPLSAMFYVQNQEFTIGKSIVLYLNTNQKTYDLNYRVVSSEDIAAGKDRFILWQLEGNAKRHDKSPRHSVRFKMWFLESLKDKKKIPVLIRVMTNIGPVTAYLTGLN